MTPHWLRCFFVGVFWLIVFSGVQAQVVLPVPELRARVMDQTGTLDTSDLAALERRLAAFEAQRGTQVVVLIVSTTQPEDISDFAQRLGDAWKIGRNDLGDSVLFVIAKDDRRMRIAPSKALEGGLPDLMARRILDQVVAPAFRRNDFAGGVGAGLEQILSRVSGEELPLPDHGPTEGKLSEFSEMPPLDLLVFLVFAVPLGSVLLRSLLGNKAGILLTGALAGGLAWLLTSAAWIALGAALLAMLAALFVQALPNSPRARWSRGAVDGFAQWGGGGFGRGNSGGFGGGGGGGFASGGGGDFGGGGASGSW